MEVSKLALVTLRLRAVSRVEDRREHERISARSCFWKLRSRSARSSIMALRLMGSGRLAVKFSSSYTLWAMRASILAAQTINTECLYIHGIVRK